MRLIYTKPKLVDLSQGSRIAFARQFRLLSQDNVSDQLGLTGECKRRTMTRYEKGNRHPKNDRTLEIAKILNVNINAIKQYEFKEPTDIIYMLMWLEELIPNYYIDLSDIPSVNNTTLLIIKSAFIEWNQMRNKRARREISYEEYIEWKLNFELKGEFKNERNY